MTIPIEKVLERAKASGFDAELRVAAILRKAGWSVRQSVYYIDKDEGKGREIDLTATRGFTQTKEAPEVTCRIYFCIEVKRTEQPFIFFADEPDDYEPGQGYGILHWKSRVDRFVLSYENIERHRPMRAVDSMARSYVSFKDAKEHQIKSGILSAFKGAVHNAETCNEVYADASHDICFFLPFVVVDGPLYECYFEGATGELAAREVDEIVYVQNYLSENYGSLSSRVTVVTIDAFERLLPEHRAWGEAMVLAMDKNKAGYRGT